VTHNHQIPINETNYTESLQERLLSIIENSTDIIGITDPEGNVKYLNRVGRAFTGVKKSSDITGLRIMNFHQGWALSQLLTEGIPYAIRDGSWVEESEMCNHAGEIVPVSQLILAHKNENGALLDLSFVMRNIQESKENEEEVLESHRKLKQAYQQLEDAQSQLLQSEKMASIGQLAAGVAHEINNPIGYVGSNLTTLENYVNDLIEIVQLYEKADSILEKYDIYKSISETKVKKDLEYLKEDSISLLHESYEGISRVKKIVQDLKDFSHVDEAEWLWVDIHKGLDSTLNIVSNEIKYKAEVIKEYGNIPEVECIASQLNQIFMNLLVNAGHAIKEHGTIIIRTGQQDESIWIEIEDSGKGMDEEIQKHIFEPFYTTKPVGQGTGLGLSLSYSIIQKHHGDLTVRSTPGKGTCFKMILPVAQPESSSGGAG